MLIALNKPYGVLSQFTPDHPGQKTLAAFGLPSGIYPIGRLDQDSEGLLLLGDDGKLQAQISHPETRVWKTYWVQVEGVPTPGALIELRQGVVIQGRKTLPARAKLLDPQPSLPPRDPPIRHRASIPATWLEIQLCEGRNRQIRRMTAAVGHPTLRLWRQSIGDIQLPPELLPGSWRELELV